MRILAVLGIEVTACVTILARISSPPPPPPPAVERAYTQGGKRRNQAKGNESWASCGALAPRTGRAPKQEQ